MCSAQSAKTVLVMVMMLFTIDQDAGPTLWATSNEQEAKKFAKARLWPVVKRCKPVKDKLPTERGMVNTCEIYFPGAQVIIGSANNDNTLQQTPYRYIFGDEVRSWPKGALEMFSKRTRSYPNYKKIIISTPDMEKDHLHRAYESGDQCMFYIDCPKCEMEQTLEWGEVEERGGMRWDKNETTCPEGRYDFEEVFKTIRYECKNPECNHTWHNNSQDRKAMQRGGRWKPHNTHAPRKRRSFHWNAILPWWTKWDEMVEERIMAAGALRMGDHEPYKDFINETLGLPWEDRLRFNKEDAFIDKREVDYDPHETWREFTFALNLHSKNPDQNPKPRRFGSIDVQGKGGRHFYFEIADYIPGGGRRHIDWGKLWSIEEIRTALMDWGVPQSQVGIDIRWEKEEVIDYIKDSGVMPNGFYNWKAMMGDKGEWYNIDGVRSAWTETFIDPNLGQHERDRSALPIKCYMFKKDRLLERQELAMRGQGAACQIPMAMNEERNYGPSPAKLHELKLQLTAYRFESERDRFGHEVRFFKQIRDDDHVGSCYRMNDCLAMVAGLIGRGLNPNDENPPE